MSTTELVQKMAKTSMEIMLREAWSRFDARCAEIEAALPLAKRATAPTTATIKNVMQELEAIGIRDTTRRTLIELDVLMARDAAIDEATKQLHQDLAEAHQRGIAQILLFPTR